MKSFAILLLSAVLLFASGVTNADKGSKKKGLNDQAKQELIDAGVTRYVDQFAPAASNDVGAGWTEHTFAPNPVAGPMCIAGTPYSVFTKVRDPKKLMIFMQGGGACWQDFYNCNVVVDSPGQKPPPPPVGLWIEDSVSPTLGEVDNPLDDWSVVYMPYCDGSVFSGDNTVFDPAWQAFIESALGLPAGAGPPFRFHRGLQNATAGIDIAKNMFPNASKILLAGSSAGGVGASGFAPFLARLAFGDKRKLAVFNDAGPVAVNPFDVVGMLARASDWMFGQFYPASCTECDAAAGQGTAIIKWRLDNDTTIRESFYSTDGDTTNRFFLKVPTQELYRDLIVSVHGEVNDAHPDRYKRFIVSGSTVHTALQNDLYYTGTANGTPLNEWVGEFVKFKKSKGSKRSKGSKGRKGSKGSKKGKTKWEDIVEDFVAAP
jgi:hypothetical protein